MNRFFVGDALTILKTLPDESVQAAITSPPYYAKRFYGVVGEIGLEPLPELFILAIMRVYREVYRVLTADGTAWINLGDTFWSRSKGSGGSVRGPMGVEDQRFGRISLAKHPYLSAKHLTFVPDRTFQALQEGRWWLVKQEAVFRQLVEIGWSDEAFPDLYELVHEKMTNSLEEEWPQWTPRGMVIWWKPNSLITGQRDTFYLDYEPILVLSKSKRYKFNKPREQTGRETPPEIYETVRIGSWHDHGDDAGWGMSQNKRAGFGTFTHPDGKAIRATWMDVGRMMMRENTTPNPYGHSAAFPPQLARRMILAATDRGDVVLDPFCGSGVTLVEAAELGRRWIGIDADPECRKMTNARFRERPHLEVGLLPEERERPIARLNLLEE